MKGNTKNTRAKVPVQENETERKLRKENDLLKVRLNAANNAIRDMENIRHEQVKQILCQLSTSVVAPGSVSGATSSPSSSPSPLLCFLMRNKKERQEHMDKNNDDDAQSSFSNACTSEASTVQMGSLTKNRQRDQSKSKSKSKKRRTWKKDVEATSSKNKSSCSRSLIFGATLLKKLAERETKSTLVMHTKTGPGIEQPVPDITPPCTPERKRSDDTESSDPTSNEFTPTPVTDILKDISDSILGIGNVRSSSAALPKEKKEKKLQSFTSRLSTKTFFSQNRGKSDESNYTFESSEYGAYPIDLYHASPISDDNDLLGR